MIGKSDPMTDDLGPELGTKEMKEEELVPLVRKKEPLLRPGYRLSIIIISLLVFFDQLEYGIVMPSLFIYLKKLRAPDPKSLLGIVLALFSISQAGANVLFGFWSDHRPFQEVLLTSVILAFLGNALYAFAQNPLFVLFARFLAGLGAGAVSVGMSYVSKVSPEENRTKIISLIAGLSNIGLVAGPAFTAIFTFIHARIGPFVLDTLTLPGHTMLILFMLLLFLFLVFFKQPPRDAAHTALSLNAPAHNTPGLKQRAAAWLRQLRGSLDFSTVSLLGIQFTNSILLSCLQAILTPILVTWYQFKPLHNSLVYASIALLFISSYVIITIFSARGFQDRKLLLIGIVVEAGGLAWGLFGTIRRPPFWLFACNLALAVIAMPFLFVTVASLFSKCVEDEVQGFLQGILQVMNGVGCAFGPLWGNFIIAHSTTVVCFAGLLVVLAASSTMFFIAFRRLLPLSERRTKAASESAAESEPSTGGPPVVSMALPLAEDRSAEQRL